MTNSTILYECKSLSNLVSRKIEKALSDDSRENPTGMQGYILGFLGDHQQQDIFQRDIEAEFQIRRPTASRILQLMEKKALIERKSVSYDARLKKVVLTHKSMKLYENVMRVIHSIDDKAIQGLTQEDLRTFHALLSKVQQNLED
jgi:DNA-binding MarR family transcriptional regulator